MKIKKYKYMVVCATLACTTISNISIAQADMIETSKEKNVVTTSDKQTMDALSVDVTWRDLEAIDHSKDTIKVQLYRGKMPYGNVVELGNGKWHHVWDFQKVEGWQNNDWSLKIVENPQGYHAEISFDENTNTFEIINHQQKEEENESISVKLKWSDEEEVDHKDDRIKVQLYKNKEPYGYEIVLGYWIHGWRITEKEAKESEWDVKVVENKEGY